MWSAESVKNIHDGVVEQEPLLCIVCISKDACAFKTQNKRNRHRRRHTRQCQNHSQSHHETSHRSNQSLHQSRIMERRSSQEFVNGLWRHRHSVTTHRHDAGDYANDTSSTRDVNTVRRWARIAVLTPLLQFFCEILSTSLIFENAQDLFFPDWLLLHKLSFCRQRSRRIIATAVPSRRSCRRTVIVKRRWWTRVRRGRTVTIWTCARRRARVSWKR